MKDARHGSTLVRGPITLSELTSARTNAASLADAEAAGAVVVESDAAMPGGESDLDSPLSETSG